MYYCPSISALSLAHSGRLIAEGPGRILGKFWRREPRGTGSGGLQANARPRKHTLTLTLTQLLSPTYARWIFHPPIPLSRRRFGTLCPNHFIIPVLFEPKPISCFSPSVQSAGATRGIICLCSLLTRLGCLRRWINSV